MKLIADSGSTKTEWCIAQGGKALKQILTAGINPYFQSADEIEREIAQKLLPEIADFSIDAVYFYGAGCATAEKNQLIIDALRRHLAASVEVRSDLVGAARSLCQHEAGIACILGTGSNSCLYDGKEVVQNISPLGFILGDEGSGAVLGKLLVGDCLKGQLPPQVTEKFFAKYGITTADVLERVYRRPFPNRYLAELSKFLGENIEEPAIHDLVYNSFRSFFVRNVMQYKDYEKYPIAFTGSVAFYYRSVLEEAATSLSLRISRINRAPMEGLLMYHA